ncbi:MAG TPA: bacitracin ABC transporter ATP-binding protein [Ruminococcaceae bacterium]|nr:bacitracin ABC transporter ATP-binding protein [Oscillospiraceae bacterium]
MDALLSTTDLTKRYQKQLAVNKVSLHVKQGAIYGFIGRNGAGKTTFLKMVSGLSSPTSGDISLFGQSGAARKSMLPRVGVLIEAPGLYPGLSAYDNLDLKRLCTGVRKPGYVDSVLKTVGLEHVGRKAAKNFSLGMKQRLGIGMALVGDPDLLVLDEPINGLDPQGIVEVRDMLLSLNKDRGMTILISSHILEELSKIATHYGIINEGHLLKELTAAQLEEECEQRIVIDLPHPEKALPILDKMGFKQYKMVDAHTLNIYERLNESSQINMTLSKENIEIRSITVSSENIEEYFLNLTKGDHHA